MFTGIIESIGEIKGLSKEGGNLHIRISSDLASELKVDQSVSHNGICLTVVESNLENYVVTAIKETLDKTNLKDLKKGGGCKFGTSYEAWRSIRWSYGTRPC